MTERILFVDDEKNILDSMKRLLRKRFEIDTALGPTAGLEMVKKFKFAVVVSDLRMPSMDGIEFLSHVRTLNEDTVRIMLTGYADLDASIAAVNEGRVFRFLTKPCPDQQLIQTLQAALDQYRLVTAEKELLRDTLRGMVSLLSEVLANLKPEIYGIISRIRPYLRQLSRKVHDPKPWEVETASMLCLLGFIFLPDTLIQRVVKGKELSEQDKQTYFRHAELAAELISHIPRMASIAQIIRYQEKGYDGSGVPYDDVMGTKIPLGARMLKVLLDFDRLTTDDTPKKDGLAKMKRNAQLYDLRVLQAMEDILGDDVKYEVKTVKLVNLRKGMYLMSDVMITHGGKEIKALAKGQVLNEEMLTGIKRLAQLAPMSERIDVIEPGNDFPE